MFLLIYNPDSNTHCYKLRGMTDQSTDATTPSATYGAIQSQTVGYVHCCLPKFDGSLT